MQKRKVLIVTALTVVKDQKEFEREKVKQYVQDAAPDQKAALCFVHSPKTHQDVVSKVKDKKHHAVIYYEVPAGDVTAITATVQKKANVSSTEFYSLHPVDHPGITNCKKDEIPTIISSLKVAV